MIRLARYLAAALDPVHLCAALGIVPDPWQAELLRCRAGNILLNCSRGAGKSRTTSILAVHTALYHSGSLVLLLAPTLRQSTELLRYVRQNCAALSTSLRPIRRTQTTVEWANGSRIIALPGRYDTIRTFQGVRLLLIDEAAWVPDDVYVAVRPMLAVSRGRTVCLSTPNGRKGFFWRMWDQGGDVWHRVQVPWHQCPRIAPEFIEQERRLFGQRWIAQEYECDFASPTGQVYPDLPRCLVDDRDWAPPEHGRRVGGIDWGFRDPFAAVWGIVDRNDVLWIEAERYAPQRTLADHVRALPRAVTWFADPSGATEIHECRAAGLTIRPAVNHLRAGIQAVTARIESGRLRIRRSTCPNLVREAELYRYPDEGERPIDADNHALDALRYLVSRLDAGVVARIVGREASLQGPPPRPSLWAEDRCWNVLA